jgi:hypothetical protein
LKIFLKGNFETKRKEVTRSWRKFYNEELRTFYSSRNIMWVIGSRRMRWAGDAARMELMRSVQRNLVRIPEGKRQLEESNHTRKDTFKIEPKIIGCVGMNWSQMT